MSNKSYKIYFTLTLSPPEYFGVATTKSFKKECVEYYYYGDKYEVDEETFDMKDFDSARNYLEAKFKDDNFNEYEYIEESNLLREESIINPNNNDADEFSNGTGDVKLDINKIELHNDDTEELLETTYSF